jgi:hypothetical protein
MSPGLCQWRFSALAMQITTYPTIMSKLKTAFFIGFMIEGPTIEGDKEHDLSVQPVSKPEHALKK